MNNYKADSFQQKRIWIFEIFKGLRKIEDKRLMYRNDWIEFLPKKWGSRIIYQKAGYFDERPQIDFFLTNLLFFPLLVISFWNIWCLIPAVMSLFLGIGKVYLCFPFRTGINECESPQYGFYHIEDTFWLWFGDTKKVIHFPWSLEWYRTSYKREEQSEKGEWAWEHEFKGKNKELWNDDKWPSLWKRTYPYIYTLKSGEIQKRHATVKVVEREWRRRWLMWTSLFNQVVRVIDVSFDKEVGERTGSWKGGTVGCSYEMKPNELPYECLRRMEKERKF